MADSLLTDRPQGPHPADRPLGPHPATLPALSPTPPYSQRALPPRHWRRYRPSPPPCLVIHRGGVQADPRDGSPAVLGPLAAAGEGSGDGACRVQEGARAVDAPRGYALRADGDGGAGAARELEEARVGVGRHRDRGGEFGERALDQLPGDGSGGLAREHKPAGPGAQLVHEAPDRPWRVVADPAGVWAGSSPRLQHLQRSNSGPTAHRGSGIRAIGGHLGDAPWQAMKQVAQERGGKEVGWRVPLKRLCMHGA